MDLDFCGCQQKVSHRVSFRGFEHVDLFHTRRAYLSLEPYDQGILRKFLHGASFTNAQAKHWSDDGNDRCILCGEPDSVSHRLWECSGTESLRAQLSDETLAAVQSSPAVLIEHGWTLRSPLEVSWFQYLDSLPMPCVRQDQLTCGPILDLFTDGSCLFPTSPSLRLASFSVVSSRPFQLDFDHTWFQPVVAMPLPGVIQTVFRAELMAVISALDFALQSGACVRVWTDCLNVVKAFQKYVLDGRPVKPNGKNADLLSWFCDSAGRLGRHRMAILKVPAHERLDNYVNDLERWLISGNSAADRAAACANQSRSAAVWNLWNSYADQVHHQQCLANAVRGHMVAVSKLWNSSRPNQCQSSAPQPARPLRPARVLPDLVWTGPDPLDLLHPTFSRSFGPQLASDVQAWLLQVRDPNQPLQWISYFQLYISFQTRKGPWYVGKPNGKWHVESGPAALLMNHVKLSVRIKHFRLMLQQFLRDCDIVFTSGTVRPVSQWLKCFRGAIGFNFDSTEYDFVEGWLSSKLTVPVTGTGQSIDAIRGI